jgi:hypothetical protein
MTQSYESLRASSDSGLSLNGLLQECTWVYKAKKSENSWRMSFHSLNASIGRHCAYILFSQREQSHQLN